MKNRIVKKILRIILLVLVGAAVIGTFYFLWKKAQPVITVYEIVTPEKGDVETKTVATGNVEPRFEVEIKPQISGNHLRAERKKRGRWSSGRDYRHYQGNPRDGTAQQRRIAREPRQYLFEASGRNL